MKPTKFLVLVACLPLLFCACKSVNLAPGGAYAPTNTTTLVSTPDVKLFTADASFRLAYTLLDNAFAFEQTNRLMLWNISPDIKHGLDKVRPEAQKAVLAYANGRAAYLAAPSPAGLTGLQNIITTVQQMGATVTAILSSVFAQTPTK